jgi:C4-dicarboxylate-specific signal transduction histidine kinase
LFVQKMLDAQPILCGTVVNGKLTAANRKLREFFDITEVDVDTRRLELRDLLPLFQEDWLVEKASNPNKPYHLDIHRKGKQYSFDVFVSISFVGSEYIYIFSMLETTEVEKLKYRELNQAKMASIGELSMGLTHEINTPLTYIKGNIDLIEMDIEMSSDEKLAGYLQNNIKSIRDGVDRINSIVELLKEYSSAKTSVHSSTNIYEVIDDTAKLIHGRSQYISKIYIDNGELNMASTVKKRLFRNIEKRKLGHVILILLNNSLDELATSPLPFKDRFIHLSVRECEDGKVSISVKDNGGGINEDIFPIMFEPFVSGKSQSGMGLGLNIAKKIIDEYGGNIRAENIETGASFEIII